MTFTRNLSPVLPVALLMLACGGSKDAAHTPSKSDLSKTCFSPTQNVDRAHVPGQPNYDSNDQGCPCEQTPENVAGFCVDSVALICEDNVWIAVEDGPCFRPNLISADTCAMRGGEVIANVADGGAADSCAAPSSLIALVTQHDGTTLPCCSKVDANKACYSPTQNVDKANDKGAQGCACELSPENKAGFCVNGQAFVCEDSVWLAVADGPCLPPALISADTCAMRGGEVLAADSGDAGVGCPAPAKLLGAITSHEGVEQPCCTKLAATSN